MGSLWTYFDEALSRMTRKGSLRDYYQEFERLGNRVQGWTQKAMVGTFMGSLKPEIFESIRMFKPTTLKEAISLARMKDEQLLHQRRFTRPMSNAKPPLASFTNSHSARATNIKRLS